MPSTRSTYGCPACARETDRMPNGDRNSDSSSMIRSVRNVDEMLPELARHVFVHRILPGQFHRDRQHVERVHRHPARGVRLFELAAGRQRLVAIEHADVVEPEEPALKDVSPGGVLSIDPPGE